MCTVGENECKLMQPYGKEFGSSSKTIKKKQLPYDLAILLFGVYLKEMKSLSQRDYIPMCTAALFMISKTWK